MGNASENLRRVRRWSQKVSTRVVFILTGTRTIFVNGDIDSKIIDTLKNECVNDLARRGPLEYSNE